MRCDQCSDWEQWCKNHGYCRRAGEFNGYFFVRWNTCEYDKPLPEPIWTQKMAEEAFRQRIERERAKQAGDAP